MQAKVHVRRPPAAPCFHSSRNYRTGICRLRRTCIAVTSTVCDWCDTESYGTVRRVLSTHTGQYVRASVGLHPAEQEWLEQDEEEEHSEPTQRRHSVPTTPKHLLVQLQTDLVVLQCTRSRHRVHVYCVTQCTCTYETHIAW